MGLEELKKQITKDLQEQLKEIQKKTEEEVKTLLDDSAAKVKAYDKEKKDLLKKTKDEISLREDALIELEGNKIIQEAKRKVIDEAFAALKEKLASLPAKERTTLIKGLLAKAKMEIDVHTVYVSQQDKSVITDAKIEDITGGIIAENKDSTVRVDYSFDSLLQEFRHEVLSELSRMLF